MKQLKQRPWLILFIPVLILLVCALCWTLYPTDYFSNDGNTRKGSVVPEFSLCGCLFLVIPIAVYYGCRKLTLISKLTWIHVVLSFVCTVPFIWLLLNLGFSDPVESVLAIILGAAVYFGYIQLFAYAYLGLQSLLLINVIIGLRRKKQAKKMQPIPAN
ncbi:hypothetical protein [Chitinophaga sp. Cy-1792]|uniref:hypothetical protein n=1 Tax=Chitinophaga sp. Cy-1792 TaxID=2608339 RepID=UPI001422307B|nr:hypothetical protein [Chitinophaga sp. Cy-1792]NIG55118.1 hypothetical protein [Chitinophaga sp. Cy-1792]